MLDGAEWETRRRDSQQYCTTVRTVQMYAWITPTLLALFISVSLTRLTFKPVKQPDISCTLETCIPNVNVACEHETRSLTIVPPRSQAPSHLSQLAIDHSSIHHSVTVRLNGLSRKHDTTICKSDRRGCLLVQRAKLRPSFAKRKHVIKPFQAPLASILLLIVRPRLLLPT